MTLLELLISLAITGVVTLGAASIMFKTSQLQVQVSNQASTSEDLSLLSQFMHQVVEQAVYVGCNCTNTTTCIYKPTQGIYEDACDLGRIYTSGTDAPNCAANTVGTAQNEVVLATFITESSSMPISAPGADCYQPTAWASIARGCKKVVQLVYLRPTRESAVSGGLASQPGTLELRDITVKASGEDGPNFKLFYVTGMNGKTLFKISNVTNVQCGLTLDPNYINSDKRANMRGFNLLVNTKILNRAIGANTLALDRGVSSFNPADASFTADRSVFRSLTEQYSFKNLSQRGLYYGAPQSRACKANGQIVGNGNWRDCCSQHLDPTDATKCASNCAYADDATTTHPGQCCSKMWRAGNICL